MNTYLNDYIENSRKLGYELNPIQFVNNDSNAYFKPKLTLSNGSNILDFMSENFTVQPCVINSIHGASNV